MSEINVQILIREENVHLFKRCVRKLIGSTFILRDKDDKLYRYLARESNRQNVSDYLGVIGYDVSIDDKSGVCMLVQREEDEDAVGLKRANIVTLSTPQYQFLRVLWSIYLECLSSNEPIFTTKGVIIDKIKSCGTFVSSTEINSAFKFFKKYGLIDYIGDNEEYNTRIELYPSLQFGWSRSQFRKIAKEHLSDVSFDENLYNDKQEAMKESDENEEETEKDEKNAA